MVVVMVVMVVVVIDGGDCGSGRGSNGEGSYSDGDSGVWWLGSRSR